MKYFLPYLTVSRLSFLVTIENWGVELQPPLGTPPNRPPKTNFLTDLFYGASAFSYQYILYLEANTLTEFGGTNLLRPPSKWTLQKPIFLNGSSKGATAFAVSRYLRYKYFDVVWGYGLPPPGIPHKTNFLNHLIYGASIF